jgi:PAS domain S-box-containing protein
MNIQEKETKLEGVRVLVIDDDPTTRMLVRESLRTDGFDVREAENGSAGLEAFREGGVDLVLCDVVMPGMNGFETCEAIRCSPGGDRVSILMATSLEDLESINRAYQAGATDFITKPINWSLLPHRVRYLVRAAHTNDKLRRSQNRNQALLDAIPDLMCRITLDGWFLEIKASQETQLLDLELGEDAVHLREVLPFELAEGILAAGAAAMCTGSTQDIEFDQMVETDQKFFEARIVFSGENEMLAIVRDITKRKAMEEQVRGSEERFRGLIENAPDLITIVSVTGKIRYGSPAVERILGYPANGLLEMSIENLVYDDDLPKLKNNIALAVAEPGSPHADHLRFYAETGNLHFMETICTGMKDVNGETTIVINSRDITERLHTERALRDSEDQLRQSQKMEAIGRLAGGVAHDFNNLLTAILGYSQILEERLKSENVATEEIQEIRKAGTRASSLTRQLLTFSRKQVMQPRVLDLNAITGDMEKMLRRLLGEDIQLKVELADTLYPVLIDPGQLEQVVMNLAINGRDAMPDGGHLVIETRNVDFDQQALTQDRDLQPGQYAMLAVNDNGVGMEEEVRKHIFEPFFSTKENGDGTGLGLSTVYGIVKQSGGHIYVYSEVDKGTTFKIYLPRTVEAQTEHRECDLPRENLFGEETVLLVEDEAWVRTLVRQCLERHGYTVLEAEHGEHALCINDRYKGEIHLLLTDVVMPKMNGVELAEQMVLLRDGIRVLYMSGYTDHAVLSHGRLQAGEAFLQKPFTIEELAGKVRRIIDTEPAIKVSANPA